MINAPGTAYTGPAITAFICRLIRGQDRGYKYTEAGQCPSCTYHKAYIPESCTNH